MSNLPRYVIKGDRAVMVSKALEPRDPTCEPGMVSEPSTPEPGIGNHSQPPSPCTPPTPAAPANVAGVIEAARSMRPTAPPAGVKWIELSVPDRNGAPRFVDLPGFARSWAMLRDKGTAVGSGGSGDKGAKGGSGDTAAAAAAGKEAAPAPAAVPPPPRTVYWDEMHALACHYRMLSGRWILDVPAAQADEAWAVISELMLRNKLGVLARMSTALWEGDADEPDAGAAGAGAAGAGAAAAGGVAAADAATAAADAAAVRPHRLMVSTYDYTHMCDVIRVLRSLQRAPLFGAAAADSAGNPGDAGALHPMRFMPDCFPALGIQPRNPHELNVFTYHSADLHERKVGVCKSFNVATGFGFIRTAEGGEIYVKTYDIIKRSEKSKLMPGERVEYTDVVDPKSGKHKATLVSHLSSGGGGAGGGGAEGEGGAEGGGGGGGLPPRKGSGAGARKGSRGHLGRPSPLPDASRRPGRRGDANASPHTAPAGRGSWRTMSEPNSPNDPSYSGGGGVGGVGGGVGRKGSGTAAVLSGASEAAWRLVGGEGGGGGGGGGGRRGSRDQQRGLQRANSLRAEGGRWGARSAQSSPHSSPLGGGRRLGGGAAAGAGAGAGGGGSALAGRLGGRPPAVSTGAAGALPPSGGAWRGSAHSSRDNSPAPRRGSGTVTESGPDGDWQVVT